MKEKTSQEKETTYEYPSLIHIFNKILANHIQEFTKRIIYQDQV